MNERTKLELLTLTALSVGAAFAAKALLQHSKKIPRHQRPLVLTAVAGGTLLLLMPRSGKRYYAGRNVLITGGSRGLGLSLASRALEQGANVTLVSRDDEENSRAKDLLSKRLRLRDRESRIFAVEADVTCKEEFESAVDKAAHHFGSVDTIINNAGAIVVGPIETMTRDDFQAQLNLHLFAPLTSFELIKKSRSTQRRASLINIASIGAKIPVPHMATYTASKFALAGASAVASSELSADNIDVTTAYPGLMRTGSAIQAVFKGDLEKEFLWFAISANAPLISKEADSAAGEILAAAANRQKEVVIGWPAKLGSFMYANFPELTHLVLKTASGFLPKSSEGITAVGEEVRELFDETVTHKLLHSVQTNERDSRGLQNQIAKHGALFNMGQ